jgi:Mrp family chromosome partitioning ATPase
MSRDSDYFRRRAAEARAASCAKGRGEEAAVAGELALAYAALARRRALIDAEAEVPAIPLPVL